MTDEVTTTVITGGEAMFVMIGVGAKVVKVTSISDDSTSVTVPVFGDKVKTSSNVDPGTSVETTMMFPDTVL